MCIWHSIIIWRSSPLLIRSICQVRSRSGSSKEIEDVIGLDASDAVLASAKAGIGIKEILEQVVAKVPAPTGDPDSPLKALIFDSHYDPYKGVIVYVRVIDGSIKAGKKIRFMATEAEFDVIEVGAFMPRMGIVRRAYGWRCRLRVAGIKNVEDTRVGDTITDAKKRATEALPGYRKLILWCICGLYPIETQDYNDLRDALEKLELNDASLRYEAESSTALGFGFRCGFLGLLHMEIIQERIEREFNIALLRQRRA